MANRKGKRPPAPVDHAGDFERQSIRGELVALRQDAERAVAAVREDLRQIREER